MARSGCEESDESSGLARKGVKMEGSVQQPWVLDWTRTRISKVFLGFGGSGIIVTWSQPLRTVSILFPVTGSM